MAFKTSRVLQRYIVVPLGASRLAKTVVRYRFYATLLASKHEIGRNTKEKTPSEQPRWSKFVVIDKKIAVPCAF